MTKFELCMFILVMAILVASVSYSEEHNSKVKMMAEKVTLDTKGKVFKKTVKKMSAISPKY